MSAASAIAYQVTSADLVTELAAHARTEGVNASAWPGVTFYRFTQPTEPQWDDTRTISIGIVAQTSSGTFDCVVIGKWPHGGCQAFEATPDRPCLCVRLEVDPLLVRQVAAGLALCDSMFETDDHGLDLIVYPDGRREWKDVADLHWQRVTGRIDDATVRLVLAAAADVVAQLDSTTSWWSAWDGWTP